MDRFHRVPFLFHKPMKNITLTSCLKHRERILKQEAAATVVLLELDGGHYYALDGAGGRAWELCDEYDASAENIAHDLLELFTELANENLVDVIA